MPEVNQLTLTHKEAVEAMLKQLDIHEGRWMLLVNFGFIGGNVGLDDETADPTAMVSIRKLGITRAESGTPPNLVVDAAKVNPARPASKARTATAKKDDG